MAAPNPVAIDVSGGTPDKPPSAPAPSADTSDASGDTRNLLEGIGRRSNIWKERLAQDRDDVAQSEPGPPRMQALPPQPAPTDPLQAFGQPAMWLAVFGSLLTRRPLTNAVIGAANVLKSTQQMDAANAQHQYDVWKIESANALKAAQIQQTAYKNVIAKYGTDLRGSTAEATTTMAMLHDEAARYVYDTQGMPGLVAFVSARGKQVAKASDTIDGLDQHLQTTTKVVTQINDADPNVKANGIDLLASTLLKDSSGKGSTASTRMETTGLLVRLQNISAGLRSGDPDRVAAALKDAATIPEVGPGILRTPVQKPPTPGAVAETNVETSAKAAFEKTYGHPPSPAEMNGPEMANLMIDARKNARGPPVEGDTRTPDQKESQAAMLATGIPGSVAVPGWGAAAVKIRQLAQADALKLIQKQGNMSAAEAGVELARREVLYVAQRSSAVQLDKMVGATRQAVDQLDFNVEKTKEEMAKLPSTNLSPVLNAMARGEEKWTGDPAYASLFYYMHATAMESARLLSSGQASIAQLNQGAADIAKQWANEDMTPASFASVAQAMHDEGQNRITTFTKAMKYQTTMPGEAPPAQAPPQTGSAQTVTPQQYEALPPGSHYKIPNDPKTYVKQ